MKIVYATLGLALLCTAMPAQAAYCFEPRAPTLLVSKPRKPFCASTRSCSQWDVDSYKRDVERYFRQLEAYVEEVNQYRRKAIEYATCMAELD